MLQMAGQDVDQYMKEMEEVQRKTQNEKQAEIQSRLERLERTTTGGGQPPMQQQPLMQQHPPPPPQQQHPHMIMPLRGGVPIMYRPAPPPLRPGMGGRNSTIFLKRVRATLFLFYRSCSSRSPPPTRTSTWSTAGTTSRASSWPATDATAVPHARPHVPASGSPERRAAAQQGSCPRHVLVATPLGKKRFRRYRSEASDAQPEERHHPLRPHEREASRRRRERVAKEAAERSHDRRLQASTTAAGSLRKGTATGAATHQGRRVRAIHEGDGPATEITLHVCELKRGFNGNLL